MNDTQLVLYDERDSTENELDLFVFTAVVLVLIGYMLTGAKIFLAGVAMFGMLYIVPTKHIRRLLGYLIFSDVLFSTWLLTVASATLGGLEMAVTAGLLYTIVSREIRDAVGWQSLAINGCTRFNEQLALVVNQGMLWLKATFTGFKDRTIRAPEPLHWKWIDGSSGGGFHATRTYRMICLLWARIKSSFGR